MNQPLAIERLHFALTVRQARVTAIAPRGRHLVHITFRGPELTGFQSGAFDDHVKVFFPGTGETVPRLPLLDEAGQPVPDADGKPPRATADGRPLIARDYTPRRFDPVRGELDIEFVLHGDGPGTRWASQAHIGDLLAFGGPRGSMVVPTLLDWQWLIGDASAFAAIGRRLEELPAACRATVILLLAEPDERLALPSLAQVERHQLPADDPALLARLLDTLPLPSGEGMVWAAAELSTARAIRERLVARGIDKHRIRAAGYWQRGRSASHQRLED